MDEPGPAVPAPEAQPMGTESPTILAGAVQVGRDRLRNSPLLMMMNGFIGGLYVTFSGVGALAAYAALREVTTPDVAWLLAAGLYPVGFVFVILGKSELFTENFLTPVLATWEDRPGLVALLRLWSITLAANLIGVTIVAFAWSAPALGLLEPATRAAFVEIAEDDLARGWPSTVAKAVVAGALVNFMSWLVIASRGALTKLVMMVVPTYLIMALKGAHSIVGSFEVLVGVFSGAGTGAAFLAAFLLPALAGNMLGGILFVAALHYAQAKEGARLAEEGEPAEA